MESKVFDSSAPGRIFIWKDGKVLAGLREV